MGRPKGGKNKYWSKEEKLRIVKKVTDKGLSSKQVSKEENVDGGTIRRWVREYLEEGEKALENKRKPGNPLVKYSRKKVSLKFKKMEKILIPILVSLNLLLPNTVDRFLLRN